MVTIGVATVWLVRGLIAITHNQFQCAETKRTVKRAWDRHLSRDLGIPKRGFPSSGAPGSTRAEGATQTGGAAGEMVSAIGTDDLDLGRGNILAYLEFSP
jgi:hypothetical protein